MGTLQAAIDKVAAVVRQSLTQPDLHERVVGLGLGLLGEGPMTAMLRENLLWSRLIKELNLRVE